MAWSAGLFVVTFVASLAVVAWLLVRLPADYFSDIAQRATVPANRHPVLRAIRAIIRNLVGVILVILGILQSLPGVPGQGVLTILIGVMLLDFPGRRRFEIWLVSRPRIYNAISRIRARYNRPPLVLDEGPPK